MSLKTATLLRRGKRDRPPDNQLEAASMF